MLKKKKKPCCKTYLQLVLKKSSEIILAVIVDALKVCLCLKVYLPETSGAG